MRRGARALVALALLVCLPLRGASADGLADESELQFQLGAAAYQRGDYTDALQHFLHSNRLVRNRRVLFNIAHTYEQLKRFADAHRYYVDAMSGEDDPEVRARVEAAITRVAPQVAVLDVTTAPPGATLYIDRRDLGSWGTSPRPLAVEPGTYRVIAELDGHEPATSGPIQVERGGRVAVALELERIVGHVRVDVTGASSAAVRVDDPRAAPACTAPCELALAPGAHVLYFAREGFQAPPWQVTVAARATSRAVAALSPLTGSVVVRSAEAGSLVSIDGRPMGFTPVVIPLVPVGRRALRVTARGYEPVEMELVVRPNEQTIVPTLEPRPQRQVIAVSRVAEQIDDAPSSVSVIDRQEIRAFGYPTIADALQGVRGLSLSTDRAYASATVRGLGQPNDYGNRVLVLSDGQPLNDNLLNSSYIGSDGRGDLGDVERIEVVRGPGSLLYGAGAFSGVVNLVPRPRGEPTGGEIGVGAYGGSALRARARANVNLGAGREVWASASVAQSAGTDVDVPLPAGAATARGVDAFWSAGTAGGAAVGPLTAQWFYHERDQRVPVGAYATAFDDPRTAAIDTRMMAEVRFEPQLAPGVQLRARAHANRYEFRGPYFFEGADNLERFYGTWFGGEARLVFAPSPRLRITAGGEAQLHPQATLRGRATAGGVTTRYLDEEQPYNFGAGYALVEGSPAPWLRLSGGARLDVYSSFGPILVPRAAAIVKPAPGHVIKVFSGRAFRAPSIYEQVYNDGGIAQVRAVDPARGLELGHESIYSLEIEYSCRFLEDWIAIAALHGSHIEGIIETVPDAPGAELVRYANAQHAVRAAGADLELRREWRRGWMLGAMYTYQRAQYFGTSLSDPRLINAPEHLASFRGVVPIVSELVSGGLRVRLEAPRRIAQASDDRTRTEVIADATVSGYVRGFGLEYVVGVYNVGDRRNEVPVSDTFLSRTMPQDGRTLLIDLTFRTP